MNLETILYYINAYGYLIIFFVLFLGIVGVPAPEESLLFLIGTLVGYHKLSFAMSTMSAGLGVMLGMLVAYIVGKRIGMPFFERYGKYMGVTPERLEKVKIYYMKNAYRTIIIGLHLPGVRQISPYFAGIVGVPFVRYFYVSLFGTVLWIFPITAIGYYAGATLHISPMYAPYIGMVFFFLFLVYIVIKKIKGKRKKH